VPAAQRSALAVVGRAGRVLDRETSPVRNLPENAARTHHPLHAVLGAGVLARLPGTFYRKACPARCARYGAGFGKVHDQARTGTNFRTCTQRSALAVVGRAETALDRETSPVRNLLENAARTHHPLHAVLAGVLDCLIVCCVL